MCMLSQLLLKLQLVMNNEQKHEHLQCVMTEYVSGNSITSVQSKIWQQVYIFVKKYQYQSI